MLDKLSLSNFKNLRNNFAVLVLAPGNNIEENNIDIIEEMMGKSGKCVYVTVNQPHSRLVQLMKKRNIDPERIFFIDCITRESGGTVEESGNSLYLESPQNLTELSISITEVLKKMGGEKFLFFDTLSTLMIYSNPRSFAKFAHFAMTKVKSLKTIGIFMMIEGEIEEQVFSEIEQFSDSTIDLRI